MVEAEAVWQGCSSQIWLILPPLILLAPLSFCLGFPPSLLHLASTGVVALLDPTFLTSFPFMDLVPYIFSFPYCHGLFILVPHFFPSYLRTPPHGCSRVRSAS